MTTATQPPKGRAQSQEPAASPLPASRALIPAVDPDSRAALQIYERLKPLKDALGVANLTDGELQVFAIVARHTGLDPFTKQIYAIKRGGRVTHQTGIDGYRSVAERTAQYAGSDEATFEECSCGQEDSPPQHPAVARVVVRRILAGGHVVEQTGVARWHELKPAHRKGPTAHDFDDAMWWRQPYNQLAKCAEANGLRKAFPRVLGGVYISEEIGTGEVLEGQAAPVAVDTPARTPAVRDRVAARRQAAEGKTTPPAESDEVEGEARELDAAADAAIPGLEREELLTELQAAGIGLDFAVERAKAKWGEAQLTPQQRRELLDELVAEQRASDAL